MTFDEYSRAVSDADVGFVLTHREVQKWGLERAELGKIRLQLGSDGGGSIVDGITRSDAVVLIWRVGASPEHIYLNGDLLRHDELAVLEPGSHFIFATKGPRHWISVAIPVDYFGAGLLDADSGPRAVLLSSPGRAEELSLLAAELHRASDSARPSEALDALEQDLIAGCLECISASARHVAGNHESFSIVDRALKILNHNDRLNFRIDELCDVLGLSERTLLRAFHRIVGIGPKRYLMLRQLNLIRRALHDAAHDELHVTGVLTDWGVSELGRFSGQYKSFFGELPSETLRGVRHTLPRKVRMNDVKPDAPPGHSNSVGNQARNVLVLDTNHTTDTVPIR